MNNNSHRSSWFHLLGVGAFVVTILAVVGSLPTAQGQNGDKKDEKRFTMEFDKAAWKDVFTWYAQKTGQPYASKWAAPQGTFSHSTPKGKTYTTQEAMGIINASLMKEGYVLVPLSQITTLVKIAN